MGKFVAVGDVSKRAYSTNGITWTAGTPNDTISGTLYSVTYGIADSTSPWVWVDE
jgi:hypothetical protein